MNWEFIIGLALPAYGIGFVWLTKTAREDPIMFAEIDKHLKVLLPLLLVSLTAFLALLVWVLGVRSDFVQAGISLVVVSMMCVVLTMQSLSFFRRIAALPPREGTQTAQPPHTPEQ